MFVSIIIPTFNDWVRLSLCLQALSCQTYAIIKFEIIIINNQPLSIPYDEFKLPENATIINEDMPGSYAARNNGVACCKGTLIGFTDSDCIPDKNWINNAVIYFLKNPAIGRIAGKIELFYSSPQLKNVELYEKVFAFNQELYVRQDFTAVTANMFTYKTSFEKVGLFAGGLLSGGDYEWSKRAQAAGITINYVDDCVVYHPARVSISELIIKAKRVGGGQAMFKRESNAGKISSVFNLIYELRPPLKTISVIKTRGSTLNVIQKITVFSLRYYLSAITAFSKFSVIMGKAPNRV